MRRFRSFRGRRPRRPMQWIPQTAAISPAGGVVGEIVLVDASSGFTGTTNPIPQIGRMTIMRVRGQVNVLNNSAVANSFVSLGIAVVQSPPGTVNPGSQGDLDYPWMWTRQYVLSGTVAAQTNFGYVSSHLPGPGGSMADVDIRVKRILQPNERLSLFVVTSIQLTTTAYLRTLISRVA